MCVLMVRTFKVPFLSVASPLHFQSAFCNLAVRSHLVLTTFQTGRACFYRPPIYACFGIVSVAET